MSDIPDSILNIFGKKEHKGGPQRQILDVAWFTPGGGMDQIAITLVEDTVTKTVQAYLGCGSSNNPDGLIEHVADWGAKLTRTEAEAMFGYKLHLYKQ